MFNVFMDDVRTPPSGWMLCRRVYDTKLLLEAGLVDKLMLDHDMGICAECREQLRLGERGGLLYCHHVEDGTALVRWMIDTGHWPKQRPTVHSANPVGAARMRDMIARYYPHD